MPAKNIGKFIAIDGIDVEARSYLAAKIGEWLTANQILNIVIKDPIGTDSVNEQLAEVIAKNIEFMTPFDKMAIEFIMRKRYLSLVVGKALSSYYWVICNGFMDGVFADYSTLSNISINDVSRLEQRILEGLVYPDEVLILDTPLSIAHKRLVTSQQPNTLSLKEFEKVYRASYQRKRTEFLIRATAQRSNHHTIEGDLDMDAMLNHAKALINGRFNVIKENEDSIY
jgi:thymidylate kinase